MARVIRGGLPLPSQLHILLVLKYAMGKSTRDMEFFLKYQIQAHEEQSDGDLKGLQANAY